MSRCAPSAAARKPASRWRRRCSPNRISCCSMNRRTISIWACSSGWKGSCARGAERSWSFRTTGTSSIGSRTARSTSRSASWKTTLLPTADTSSCAKSVWRDGASSTRSSRSRSPARKSSSAATRRGSGRGKRGAARPVWTAWSASNARASTTRSTCASIRRCAVAATCSTTSPLRAGYQDGTSEQTLVATPELRVERGDRVAIIGKNGSGKSTLLKSIVGQLPPLKGRVGFGVNVKPAYYAQGHESLPVEGHAPLHPARFATDGR